MMEFQTSMKRIQELFSPVKMPVMKLLRPERERDRSAICSHGLQSEAGQGHETIVPPFSLHLGVSRHEMLAFVEQKLVMLGRFAMAI
jgi:hypothetical protein